MKLQTDPRHRHYSPYFRVFDLRFSSSSLIYQLIFQEILKTILNISDIVCIYWALQSAKKIQGNDRPLGVGLGWAFAESLASRFVFMWIGARSFEFDWSYLGMALEGSFSLVQSIFKKLPKRSSTLP